MLWYSGLEKTQPDRGGELLQKFRLWVLDGARGGEGC